MVRISILLFTLGGFLASLPAVAQQSAAESYKILGISVEGGSTSSGTESGAIIANSGLKVGEIISVPGDQVQQAIQRLWALRIFSDIQVLVENKVADGVYLLIKVKEYPRFENLVIRGADEVDDDDIRKRANLTKGQILTPDDINKAVKNVKGLYEEEGHLLADVKVETVVEDSARPNYSTLRLYVDEGPSVRIDRIRFRGNSAFSEDELKSEFEDTREKTWWKFWSSPQFERKKFEKDTQRLLSFYRKHGYLDAEVVSDSVWYSPDRKKINVLVTVSEGVQYKVRDITWEGATVYSDDVLNERLGFAPGMVFNQERFEQNLRGNRDQTDVASLYLDHGYLKFNLDPDIRRVGEDSLDIAIRVYERNQFRIGRVDITGNRKTYDNVIRRELFTRPGDYFSRAAIFRSLRQLAQLNYFNPEKLRPDTRIVDEETVDLVYEVEEKSSDNINASVGYSGAFGVTGALGFTIQNFSLREPLQGGAGQVLNFDWQFGEGARFRTFSLSFTEPWLYNTPTTLGVSLYDTRQIFIYDLQQTGLSVRVGRGRLSWLDDYSRLDYIFRFQRNDVRDNGGNQLYPIGKTIQLSITQTLSRNSTDSPIFPSSGSSVSITTELAGGPLPGNVDYHKWLFNADWYVPLFGSNRIVFSASSTFGYLDGFQDNANIPPIEYFFMGGTGLGYVATTPLRGYEDRAVGPRDFRGEIGGRVLTKQSLEMRFALALNPIPIYLLGFAEGGNVFSDFRHADLFDLKRSYGFGARLMIQPIGMIGFDYGYGVDDVFPRDGKPDGWRFHFQFGRGF